MSKPSQNYLDKVERWLLGGVSIRQMVMSADQKFRARLAYEAYQIWLQDKQIKPTDIMRRLAAREYPILLQRAAEGNAEAQEYVDAMRVRPGVPRTFTEISNDVAVFNWLIGRFDTPIENIEKAKVLDASDWLIREGMKMGDSRSVKSGADIKMQLHNNFQEKEDVTDQMPNTEINITGDVTIIKSDRASLTPEERRALGRRFGVTDKEYSEMVQQEDGSWQMADEQSEEEQPADIFNPVGTEFGAP